MRSSTGSGRCVRSCWADRGSAFVGGSTTRTRLVRCARDAACWGPFGQHFRRERDTPCRARRRCGRDSDREVRDARRHQDDRHRPSGASGCRPPQTWSPRRPPPQDSPAIRGPRHDDLSGVSVWTIVPLELLFRERTDGGFPSVGDDAELDLVHGRAGKEPRLLAHGSPVRQSPPVQNRGGRRRSCPTDIRRTRVTRSSALDLSSGGRFVGLTRSKK